MHAISPKEQSGFILNAFPKPEEKIMTRARHRICLIVALLGASLISGCGQKGPLYLPGEKPAPTQPQR
jgi:predicted small lipoprotein YifL